MSLLNQVTDPFTDALNLGDSDDADENPDETEEADTGQDDDAEDDASDAGLFGDEGPDGKELEEQISDVQYELQETVDRIESIENNVKTVEGQQEEMEDEMDDVNARIRNLLGIYDEFVESENPFQGNNDTGSMPAPDTTDDSDDFEESESENEDGEDALTVDDLREKSGLENESGAEEADASDGDGGTGRFEGVMDDETFLTKPPLTYAGEVVAYEWLAFLIGESGSAGALKAMNYYENLEWLSPDVRDYMITLLSAPAMDVDSVSEAPENLSSETHKQSFRYIMKMSSVNREYVKEQHAKSVEQ